MAPQEPPLDPPLYIPRGLCLVHSVMYTAHALLCAQPRPFRRACARRIAHVNISCANL